ncbi:hypothetical protein EWM64_g5418 [Hericium alpestre]|uniref:Uncharacterized protein n=1 Tax=Hericium alpestre TaxID=135208 RepID=A0A4Y9ZX48_9AGAM|nr:hypothetical protein EWM64_g5418 [Hericium alpestre]
MTSGAIVPRAIPRPGASLRKVAHCLVSSAKHILAHGDAARAPGNIPRRILADKANICSANRLARSASELVKPCPTLRSPSREKQAKTEQTKAASIAVRKSTQATQRGQLSVRFSTPLAVPSPRPGILLNEPTTGSLSTCRTSTKARFLTCPRTGVHADSRVLAASVDIRSPEPPTNAESPGVLSDHILPTSRPLEHIFEPLTLEESGEMDARTRGSFPPASNICPKGFDSNVPKDATTSPTDENFDEPGGHQTIADPEEAEAAPEAQGDPSFEEFLRVEAECIRLRREVQQWHELFEKVI